MNEVIIRGMVPADINSVLRIERDCKLSPWTFSGYLYELEREDSILCVAEKEYKIVGFVAARLIMPVEEIGEAEILNIAVKEGFRKQGIGLKLLNVVFEAAKTNHIKHIWLEVRETNINAQTFYRAHGFKAAGKRKKFYKNPIEDAVLMKADL